MKIIDVIFWFFFTLACSGGLMILVLKNIMHAVLGLLVVFLSISAIYILLGADFLAITQLVIYIGGVIILLMFGVMYTSYAERNKPPVTGFQQLFYGLSLSSSFCLLFVILYMNNFQLKESYLITDNASMDIQWIGTSLMTRYVIIFELAGVLLLGVLMGASLITGRK